MTYRFHDEALDEYEDAALRYRKIRHRLGDAFVDAVERGIDDILEFPDAFPEVEEGVRRHLVRRFPFGIFYVIEPDGTLFIVGVSHLKRRPGYWHSRLP